MKNYPRVVKFINVGGRRQVVKAAACGAAIRGFESPRSPSKILQQNYLTCIFELKIHKKFLAKC